MMAARADEVTDIPTRECGKVYGDLFSTSLWKITLHLYYSIGLVNTVAKLEQSI